jgi:hypothetical protein
MDPYTICWWIAAMIISAVISSATAPRPQDAKPAALTDFDFPQFEEGTPQCVIFGDCWVPDFFILGLGNFRTEAITSDSGK